MLCLSALAGLLLVVVAGLRFVLGAPESAAFLATLVTLPLVCARAAGQASPFAGYWIAAIALIAGGAWWVVAQMLSRRAPDPVFLALVALQLFWAARYTNSLLPPAGPISLASLSLPQQLNFGLGLLLLLALFAAWAVQKKPIAHPISAPSRITGFLRRRRLPSRILGALLMAAAVLFTLFTARDGAIYGTVAVFAMPGLFVLWLIADALYLAGRKLWQRLE